MSERRMFYELPRAEELAERVTLDDDMRSYVMNLKILLGMIRMSVLGCISAQRLNVDAMKIICVFGIG